MRPRRGHLIAASIAALAAGCPAQSGGPPDALAGFDAGTTDAARGGDGAVPWRHTIVIDGTNDFTVPETFPTTSVGFSAYVTWDDDALYLGYTGADVSPGAADSGQKWVFVYLDLDPGAGTGAASGEQYNTQTPTMPSGLAAERYWRWKVDGTLGDVRAYAGGAWSTVDVPTAAAGTDFVEVAIPWTSLGQPEAVGVVGLMLNEKAFAEGAYAGLYADSFTDGYYPSIPISRWLWVDRASARAPTSPDNRRP